MLVVPFSSWSLCVQCSGPTVGSGGGKDTMIGSRSLEQRGVSRDDLEKQHGPAEQTAPGFKSQINPLLAV